MNLEDVAEYIYELRNDVRELRDDLNDILERLAELKKSVLSEEEQTNGKAHDKHRSQHP